MDLQCVAGRGQWQLKLSPGILPLEYLCSDSAGKAPHGFVRSVVLPTTPHFKGERDRVSFHLQISTAGRGGKKRKYI